MSDLVEPFRRPKNDFDCAILLSGRGMPLRHMPKGCSSPSAKIQIDFDWSKFGGGLEEVCNHAGISYIYLHFNVLTLSVFNVFYTCFSAWRS